MKKSNCVIYAVVLHCHLTRKGFRAYYKIRWSDWGPFPHVLVEWESKQGTVHVASFKPVDPTRRRFPPPLFVGYIAWGDPDPNKVAPLDVSE
jgi:hypothetical protein